MSEVSSSNIQLAALHYLKLALPIIPLCSPKHLGMGHSHRQECKSPGKAPTLRNWVELGVPSKEDVLQWFTDSSHNNIGLILGDTGDNNLVGIDVDGDLGETLLEQWSGGDLPDTWEFSTRAGRRLLYRLPEGFKSKKFSTRDKSAAHEELALLAQGQQTVIPPSVHESGHVYAWVPGRSPREMDLADAPDWLTQRVALTEEDANPKSRPVTETEWTQQVTEGGRSNQLARLAGSLIARGNIPKDQVITFLDAWNQQNCKPPLPRTDVVSMVESLYASEAMKAASRASQSQREKKRGGTANGLRPMVFAQAFVKRQKDQGFSWKYIYGRGVFYVCDDAVGPWAPVNVLVAQKLVREMLIEEDTTWDKMSHVNEVVNALRELLSDSTMDDIFDLGTHPDMMHIYVNNGMLHWPTMRLLPWTPQTYSTIKLPVNWEAAAPVPAGELAQPTLWEKTLQDWLPDLATRMFLQEYIGYCLVPDTGHRTAVLLYGSGSNGKSLFLDVISKLFGSHISYVPLHRLADRFETASLMDKLVNICGDIDAKFLSETGVLKALISGDVLRGEYKHGQSFHFSPVARLIFSANELPRSGDRSEGWYSRWRFIHFAKQFTVDPGFKYHFLNEMSKPENLTALLQWAIVGLRRLHRQGKFTSSEAMQKSEAEYRVENDNVAGFVSQCLERIPHTGADSILAITGVYSVYKAWSHDNGTKPVGQIEFSKRLKSCGIESGRRNAPKYGEVGAGSTSICLLGMTFSEYARDLGLLDEYGYRLAIRQNR